MELSVIGMDIPKNVFQLHCVDRQAGEIERIKLRRNEVLPYFARRTLALVAMEADRWTDRAPTLQCGHCGECE
jgi:transposase